jgi:hypothetical protein
MTDYTLDVSKWRCGNLGPNQLGDGGTRMLNAKGYMCCLGQFASQKGVEDGILLDAGFPITIANKLNKSYDDSFITTSSHMQTELAHKLMSINDYEYTTVQQKIYHIRDTLVAAGHTLTVINQEGLV